MTDTQKIHEFAEKNLLVERYLLDELTDADLEDFEQHLFECSTCFEAVKAGRALTQSIAVRGVPRQASPSALVIAAISIIVGLTMFVLWLLIWGTVE